MKKKYVPDGQELPLQDWDCFLMQVPLLPRLSHGTLLLLSVVPVPQDTEHDDQVLQGSDTGRGAADGDLCSLVDFCRTKKTLFKTRLDLVRVYLMMGSR